MRSVWPKLMAERITAVWKRLFSQSIIPKEINMNGTNIVSVGTSCRDWVVGRGDIDRIEEIDIGVLVYRSDGRVTVVNPDHIVFKEYKDDSFLR